MATGLPLELHPVRLPIGLSIAAREELKVTREESALAVFTDLRATAPVTALATMQIDRALNRMIDTGVRFLFVVDAEAELVGSITSYDIAGEKPIRFLQARGGHFGSDARADVLVRDIMTPIERWRVLDYDLARRATVGTIADTIERTGLTHVIVVEPGIAGTRAIPGKPTQVQGLFSATRIERALGAPLDLSHTKHTFADIERAFHE